MRFYFDMETIPDQRSNALQRILETIKPPGNIKKQESIDKWLIDKAPAAAQEKLDKTCLDGLYGEICSVSWAVEDGDIGGVTRGLDGIDSEHDLLTTFWGAMFEDINKELDKDGAVGAAKSPFVKLQWIGHNVIDFDLRFLKQRSIVRGIKPTYLVPADARHGSDYAFDTMKDWAGFRGYVKQDELVEALGIVHPGGRDVAAIDGSMIAGLYASGQFQLIADYNALDVYKVRELYRRMTHTEAPVEDDIPDDGVPF